MKKYLVHIILCVFLFTGIHTAVAGTKFPAVEKEVCMQPEQLHDNDLPAPAGEGELLSTDHLPGYSFTNNQDIRSGCPYRRMQVSKDLLLLLSEHHTKITATSPGHEFCIADRLEHYSLFLFPYHFFW